MSRKKLESSTSAAAVHRRPKRREERDKVFYSFGGAAPNRVIKPRKQSLTLDGKKGRANLSKRKLKTRTVHLNSCRNEK